MPTEVYQEPLTVKIDLLEAKPLIPEQSHRSSYPYPYLLKTGRTTDLELPTLAIENPFLKVVVAPTLGGRILRIIDKRSGIDVVPFSSAMEIGIGGPRGVHLHSGIAWSLTSEARLNGLGPVDFQIVEGPDDESPGGVWLAEIISPLGVSVHLGISLPPDAATIEIEMRCVNRTFKPVPYNPSLQVFGAAGSAFHEPGSAGFYDEGRRAGLLIDEGESLIGRSSLEANTLYVSRIPKGGATLPPFGTDAWSVTISAFSGLEVVRALSSSVALAHAGGLALQGARELEGKLVLQMASRQTVEAPVQITPAETLQFGEESLPGIPEAAVILDEKRDELLRWPSSAAPEAPSFEPASSDRRVDLDSSGRLLKQQALHPELRLAALVALGIKKMRRQDMPGASAVFEDVLSIGADHPIVWWLRAMAERNRSEDGPELSNAHFLAPLEPLLRAASFLSQNNTGKDRNPLLDPLRDNPDAMVEVACWLWTCGLFEELSKWVDECLRHRDVPMLRYVLASALLKGSRMGVEASQHVAEARNKPINPPYPWRDAEFEVLTHLAETFPGDRRIQELLQYQAAGSNAPEF